MALQDIKDQILTSGSANPAALSYLNLCLISYQPASAIPSLVAKMPPLSPGGSWQCTWGPAEDKEKANLVFVAVYYDGPGLPPVLAATVVRGTDLDINNFWGSLEQLWEDMDVLVQAPLPWLSDKNVLAANGTLETLATIQNMLSRGTLREYLVDFLGKPANGKPLLVVTGHSLGGCLTTVVAPWLQFVLKQAGITTPIVPATFAAPTAGNAAFARYFESCFSYQLRYHNSLDLAPTAWSDIGTWGAIYDNCGFPLPDLAFGVLVGWLGAMWEYGVSYAQPFPNVALKGACQKPKSADWYHEAYYQHHATTYWSMMGGGKLPLELLTIPSVAPRRRISRSRIYAKLGSPQAWAEKLR